MYSDDLIFPQVLHGQQLPLSSVLCASRLQAALVCSKVPFVLQLQIINGPEMFNISLATSSRVRLPNTSLMEMWRSQGYRRAWRSSQLQMIGWRAKNYGKQRNIIRQVLLAAGLPSGVYMYVLSQIKFKNDLANISLGPLQGQRVCYHPALWRNFVLLRSAGDTDRRTQAISTMWWH